MLPEWDTFASPGSLRFPEIVAFSCWHTPKGEIMKRILIASAAFASLLAATSASAADLPAYSKAPAVAVLYDWTGPYIGTNVGYSWGRGTTNGSVTGSQNVVTTGAGAGTVTTALPTLPLSGRANVNGFIGGAQLGYNWQRATWLYGLEGDIQFSNERGSGDVCTVAGCPTGSTVFTRDYKLDWFGTARGRVGYLPTERLLLYATGGAAYGNFSGSSWTLPLNVGTWSSLRVGWTAGAGVEAALGSNWSVKFEYLYMDLGNVGGSSAIVQTATTVGRVTTSTGLSYLFNTKFTDSIARVGLNYRFGGPVVAAY
jgi:outer membrane immunogenic protein